MAFSVKSKAADAAVRRLAKLKNKSLTQTIQEAVETELRRVQAERPLTDRLDAISERYRAFPSTGLRADKAFFDDLSGDV
jgi:antitoxin VapB